MAILKANALSLAAARLILADGSALWLAPSKNLDQASIASLATFIGLPWKLALVESSSGKLATAVDAEDKKSRFVSVRGFVYQIAGDPEKTTLPKRCLPVFLLNGRDDSNEASERPGVSKFYDARRRLNAIGRLVEAQPSRLLVVCEDDSFDIEGVIQLFDQSFHPLITVISPHQSLLERARKAYYELPIQRAISLVNSGFAAASAVLTEAASAIFPDSKTWIRYRTSPKTHIDLDISACDLVEDSVLATYETVQSRDLVALSEGDLTRDDVSGFFGKKHEGWRPYAAGLPWERNRDITGRVIRALNEICTQGSEANALLLTSAESGAGGTTFLRAIAYEVARAGFPVLIAKPGLLEPNVAAIATFLLNVRRAARTKETAADSPEDENSLPETAWLLVFDHEVWKGREHQLSNFFFTLRQRGRSALVLYLTGSRPPEALLTSGARDLPSHLHHILAKDEALSLGQHLNRFLKPLGQAKQESEWLSFWESHRPNVTNTASSFWIALEFWLRGYLDIRQSVQSWVATQLESASITTHQRQCLLLISAFSIERRALPDSLLPTPKRGELPNSVQLSQLAESCPALGLVTDDINGYRQWALVHDLIGRYVINAFIASSKLRATFESPMGDAVQFRLALLKQVATSPLLADPSYRPVAIDLAVHILKLDQEGNVEFFRNWRDVLGILESVSPAISKNSRTFKHHVAISRRRVATNQDLFDATEAEQATQLELAIEELKYALNSIDPTPEDESNLNLYNSLALAYQNLLTLERRRGASQTRIGELRIALLDAVNGAIREDATNSYVLETAARFRIQNASFAPEHAARDASEALAYVFQAAALEESYRRQASLSKLANDALKILREHRESIESGASKSVDPAVSRLTSVWLTLLENEEQIENLDLARVPDESVVAALELLPVTAANTWLELKLRYDLLGRANPWGFKEQLDCLDAMDGIPSYVMPLQLRLERAILLHQVGRHPEANEAFKGIRIALRSSDAFLVIPERLRWLRQPGSRNRQRCEARVLDSTGFRQRASIFDLKGAQVPFNADEFPRQLKPGARFACHLAFRHTGPIARPIESAEAAQH